MREKMYILDLLPGFIFADIITGEEAMNIIKDIAEDVKNETINK